MRENQTIIPIFRRFRLLYGFLILQHFRRELVWLGVTARPSARWIARQLTENNPETLSRIQSLADYTIDTLESSFQKRQGATFVVQPDP